MPNARLRQLAEAIFEFERNITHQREIFATCCAQPGETSGIADALETEAALTDDIDEVALTDERQGKPDEDERSWLLEAQTFMRRQLRIKQARARRHAVEEIVRADRYMRRAANQLIRRLKSD